MSDCATTEKIMDVERKPAEYAPIRESDSPLIMGKTPPAKKVPTSLELVPTEESEDVMSQAAQIDTVTKLGNRLGSQDVDTGTIILVKEALPTETVAFVSQKVTSRPVKGGRGSSDVQITVTARETKEGPINSGAVPPHRRQSIGGEKSKSTSAVDNLVESPHHRRMRPQVDTTEAEWTDQRPITRRDDDMRSEKNTVTEVLTKSHLSRELHNTEWLREMDDRTDSSSGEGANGSRAPESAGSYETISCRSTTPRSEFDCRTSSPRQTPDFIHSARSLSSRAINQSLSSLSDSRKSSRSQTPDPMISVRSRSSRSTNQSFLHLSDASESSRSQTPDSMISVRSRSSRSTNQSFRQLSDSRKSSRTQTPDSIFSAHSLSSEVTNQPFPQISDSSRSTNQLSSHSSVHSNLSRKPLSKTKVSGRPRSSSSTEQGLLSVSPISRNTSHSHLSDDSDCIVGPFPIFTPVPPRDAMERTDSSQSTHSEGLLSERSSIGSSKKSSIMQSPVDLERQADLTDDSDYIVGPFPLFAACRSKETSLCPAGSHADLEPEAYSSDESDCIVGPFPLFAPGRPKDVTHRTSHSSIGSHSDFEPEANSSDDSDYIVGSFAPGPSKIPTRDTSPQSTASGDLSLISSVKSVEGSAYSSDESDCIVGPFPIFARVPSKESSLSECNNSLSENDLSYASEDISDSKSISIVKPTTCWTENSDDTKKSKAKTPSRLRRGFNSLRKGLRRLVRRFSNLATNCFPAPKK